MIGQVIRDREEFGVVLATEKGIANTGCTASIDQVVRRYPDGRLDILTRGRRRFEISALDEELAYLRGEVTYFEDDENEEAPFELRRSVAALGRQMDSEGDYPEEDPFLSFRVAARLPDAEVKQVILSMRSENDRIRHLAQYVPGFLGRQRLVDKIRVIAPRNGHSKHLKDEQTAE
jgi:ATP-dependent Lon protease